ncbi:MAG: GDP-fucose synthetase [Pelagibacteraceae bacterium]|nr:GDP-fucose synthetase [Pelagibacteraceae bacterium]
MKPKVLIAGQEGMVGSSIYKLLKKKKNFNIIECKRKDLDFTNQLLVEKWFKKNKPDIVINAAGKVGGILDNKNFQPDYIYINSMIGLNIINSSFRYNVKKLINLGSACIYPKKAKQPIKENSLLSSFLEETNEGYALAKILSLKYSQHLKKKNKKEFISLMPANLYGEGDNFNLNSSHVLPALTKKFILAKINNHPSVQVWGSGKVKREFLNVEDLSHAIFFLIKKKIKYDYINIGGGEHFSIKKIAQMLKKITNYKGKIIFNRKYPDGVKRRQLDSNIMKTLGWKPKIKLENGLKNYCQYYMSEIYPHEKN